MLRPALSPLTKAIVPVHLYGHPPILMRWCISCKHDIPIVEDCAQGAGGDDWPTSRSCGSGRPAALVFYPTKNLARIGDGGMVTSMHADWSSAASLATYGWSEPQFAEMNEWAMFPA